MKGEKSQNIVLGKGVFEIDDIPIGLTRDGGQFTVEVDNKLIEADGDRGTVKGRVVRNGATPKLEINHLEVLTGIEKMHPAINVDTTTVEGKTRITGTGKIDDEKDYHDVKFKGETKDGRKIEITVENAINLENIDWALKDKDEIIDKVTFTGTYDPQAEDEYKEPWLVEYDTPTVEA